MGHPFRSAIQELEALDAAESRDVATQPPFRRTSVSALLATTALCSIPAAQAQTALPQGGQVAAGAATITASGNTTAINQTSQRAIVNWDSFSVGPNGSVTIAQPNADAAILNRVTGAASTSIAGSITANGQVYLVNPNGIAITPTGTVNVGGGFVASTLDIRDDDFQSGRLNFAGSGTSAVVSNRGTISVGSGGFAALLGGSVANAGTVSVPLGKIGMGAGAAATLDLSGDGFLQVVLPTQADGTQPLIDAGGKLVAARIELRASNVVGAIRDAVNVPGELTVRGAHMEGGAVVLDGGAGTVNVSGTIDASSSTANGGTVTIEGDRIALTDTSKLLATGATGGGTVLVGGNAKGAPGLAQATNVAMASGAVIDVSAMGDGKGGTAVLWSDVNDANSMTTFTGTIRARGAGTGDGGLIETSGHQVDTVGGFANAGSDFGKGGLWLIDPADSVITQAIADGYAATLDTGTSVLNDVTGTITWNSGVTLTKSAGGDATLTLRTSGSGPSTAITLTNATIKSTFGALNLVLWTRYGAYGNSGPVTVSGSTINTNGGQFWLGGEGNGAGTPWNGIYVGGGWAATWNSGERGAYIRQSSITTGTGDISIAGYSGSTVANTGINQFGVWIDSGTTLSTTSGAISILGTSDGWFKLGGGIWIGDTNNALPIAISTTSGQITLNGRGADRSGSGTGWRHGLMIYRGNANGSTTISSTSGLIVVVGAATFSPDNYTNGDSSGIQIQVLNPTGSVGITSQTGSIWMAGSNTLESAGTGINALRLIAPDTPNAIRIGYDGVTPDSGSVWINADSISQKNVNAGAGSLSVQTNGNVIIQPTGSTFTYLRANTNPLTFDNDWNFGSSASSLTIGNTTNTLALTLSNAITTAGAITIDAGDLTVNAPLSAGGGGITLNALGSGGISGSTAGTFSNFSTLTFNVANAAGTGIVAGVISGSGNVVKDGPGEVTPNAPNSFSGSLTIAQGAVALINADGLGAAGNAVQIAAGAALNISNTLTTYRMYSHVWTGSGAINFASSDNVKTNYLAGNGIGFTGTITTSGAGKTGFSAIDLSNAAIIANAGTTVIDSTTSVSFGSLAGSGWYGPAGTGLVPRRSQSAISTPAQRSPARWARSILVRRSLSLRSAPVS